MDPDTAEKIAELRRQIQMQVEKTEELRRQLRMHVNSFYGKFGNSIYGKLSETKEERSALDDLISQLPPFEHDVLGAWVSDEPQVSVTFGDATINVTINYN